MSLNTIVICELLLRDLYVRYLPDVNREIMNINLASARKVIAMEAKSYGWTAWLKTKEDIQMADVKKMPTWLEPRNATRLEWLVLEIQATEGVNEFGKNGVTVQFYLNPDSAHTGEILCHLLYLPGTQPEMLQMIENGIQERFELRREVNPWAHLKIVRTLLKP